MTMFDLGGAAASTFVLISPGFHGRFEEKNSGDVISFW
jgi:hypothetical protein